MLNVPLMPSTDLIDLNRQFTDLAMTAVLDRPVADEAVIVGDLSDAEAAAILEDDSPGHPERSGLWILG